MDVDVRADTEAVIRDLGFRLPALTKAAQVTALNRTNSKIGTAFRRGLSQDTGIKQKILKSKFRRYGAKRSKPRARTWFGLGTRIPISAVLKGRTRKLPPQLEPYVDAPGGANGSDVFRASFGGRPETLFRRVGPNRFPIKALKLDLSPIARRVMARVAPPIARREYKRELARDIRRRLAGHGTRRRR